MDYKTCVVQGPRYGKRFYLSRRFFRSLCALFEHFIQPVEQDLSHEAAVLADLSMRAGIPEEETKRQSMSLSLKRKAFPDQAHTALNAAEEQGTLQGQILPVEFKMALLIRPRPVGQEGGLDVVRDGLCIGID
jgi:hypothetical protein